MKNSKMRGLVWAFIGVFLQCCIVSPASAFSIGEEREIGEKLLYSIRSSFELIDSPDVTQYITRLGQSVLVVAGIQYFDYHFFIVKSKDFNAFAAPSGLIFFYSGLIEKMNSEDELVSVLAHEIGHIAKRHLASRMEKGKYTTIGSVGLAVAALAFGGAAGPALMTGALATGQSMSLHFSRKDEEEADLMAYGWMKELGRDPEGQVKMLETMRRVARYRSEKLPQYLLTHPNPEERLNYISSLLDIEGENIDETADTSDNFAFIRFKYRVLVHAKESRDLKAFFASVLADSRATEFMKMMANYGLSQVAKTENDYKRSLSLLEQVIEYFPDENILLADKGSIEFAAGQLDEAEKTLKSVLTADSSDMYATFTLAKLLYRTGRIAEAEEYFTKVSYELPEFSKVYFELGQIASDQKMAGESSFYLGKYHLYEGKMKQAEQNLKNALRLGRMPEKMQEECKALLKKIEKMTK